MAGGDNKFIISNDAEDGSCATKSKSIYLQFMTFKRFKEKLGMGVERW